MHCTAYFDVFRTGNVSISNDVRYADKFRLYCDLDTTVRLPKSQASYQLS